MSTQEEPSLSQLPEEIRHDKALAHKFRIDAILGAGGMAMVVAAHHLELDQRVALKFLLPEATRSNAAVARFRKEARAAAMIKNEHVVRILDVCVTVAGVPYIVMEYLEGRDLEQVLQDATGGRLPVPDAVDFVLQASEALAEGHRLGIVHRDLKPANLFCVDREDGQPMIKVLDFGISKVSPKIGEVESTDRWEILGSPRYMSPEQIDSARDVDRRSDIWSLGVVLYQSIAGRVPFGGEIVPDLWRKIHGETPRRLSDLRSCVPEVLDRVVMRCLEKEPSRRYSDLSEFAVALSAIAPERSQRSIANILRSTANTSTPAPCSLPVATTDKTLAARYLPRESGRWYRGGMVVALGTGLLTLLALSVLRMLLWPVGDSPGGAGRGSRTTPLGSLLVPTPEPIDDPELVATGSVDRLQQASVPSVIPVATSAAPRSSAPTGLSMPRRSRRTSTAPAPNPTETPNPPLGDAEPPPAFERTTLKARAAPEPAAASATSGAPPSAVVPSTIPWVIPPVQTRRKHQ
ncbi:MAG: serine/threonine protein kinase [Polyangiaceae bacterium]|nr:serine/threonine protein kinase [Polyangiaceae bacterium]